jgi:hypothetical protein
MKVQWQLADIETKKIIKVGDEFELIDFMGQQLDGSVMDWGESSLSGLLNATKKDLIMFVDKNGIVLSKGMSVKYKWCGLSGTGVIKYLRYGYPKELGFSDELPLAMVDFNEKKSLNGAEMGTDCLEVS